MGASSVIVLLDAWCDDGVMLVGDQQVSTDVSADDAVYRMQE